MTDESVFTEPEAVEPEPVPVEPEPVPIEPQGPQNVMRGSVRHPDPKPQPDLRIINANTQAAVNRTITAVLATRPETGPGLERLVQDYPSMSRDMAAGLVMSGQVTSIPTLLLDELAERDRQQQAAATDGWLYSGLKTSVRGSILGMEDLWNMSPIMALPRYGINRYQGQTHEESWGKSQTSVLGTQMAMGRLGLETDYGSGFLPSEELVPGGAGYFDSIRQMILDGTFEGSTEEQILAATQEAMVKQAQEIGMSPWALARANYLSTSISRTINGENYAVPFSPGAALAINVTTPGTRSYALASGFVDATFRVTMEPVDIVFDNVGDAILKSVNPKVGGDFMSFINKGSEMMHDVLKGFGIDVAYEPILIRGQLDAAGNATKRAKAVTGPELNPDGTVKVTMDVEQTSRSWYQRVDDMDDGANRWIDPDDPYAKAYIDRGMTPDDVRAEIARQGGVEGENMLTLEHELVHSEVQLKNYDIQVREDGTRWIDTTKLSDEAPEEMKVIAAEIEARDLGYDRVTKAAEDLETFDELVKVAEADVKRISDELSSGVGDEAQRAKLTKEYIKAKKDLKALKVRTESAANAADEVLQARRALNEQMSAITEAEAVGMAWDNMVSGKWSGKTLMKRFKRQAGLTNRLRPWVNPKSFTEWLQSKKGKRTIESLARMDDFEELRRVVGYLDDKDIVRIMDTDDTGKISTILQDQFNAPGNAGLKQPTIGRVRDTIGRGFDAWSAEMDFIGGPVAQASKAMGRSSRRARVSVGNHILSVTDRKQTLDTINSLLSTIGVDKKLISALQRKAVMEGDTATGIDEIAREIERLSKERLKEMGSKVYTDAEVDKMWEQWRGYDEINRHYWVSNAGKDRRWLFENNKFRNLTEAEEAGRAPEAFMEAQFAATHRVMPDVRRMRRLHSKQRNAYERAMQWRKRKDAVTKPDGTSHKGGWQPTGFDTTRIMHAGDVTFGLWRDVNLMRMGWAMRVIPEEQLRFGATGFSGMFTNPIDYFISMLNRMDFKIPGDELTLGEIIRIQEGLGTAGLRDPAMPVHVVSKEGWKLANQVEHPEHFWAGMSREFILSSMDEVTSMVARIGRKEALKYFRSPKGRETIKRIAGDAAQENSLAKIANDKELVKYLDVVELRIAQITGGDGLWHNPVANARGVREWVNTLDQATYRASDITYYNDIASLKQAIRDEVVRKGGDPDEVLRGKSKMKRKEAEALLNEVRGYDLDELEQLGHVAIVTREGNDDIRGLIANKTLDEILITDDMPMHEIRLIDEQLRKAFEERGANAPDNWAVPKGDLDLDRPGGWSALTDNVFHALNGVPSRVLNRSPFFQQSFGAKIAESYFFGDSALRSSIDDFIEANPSFKITFDLGKRKVFRDMGVNKFPKPFEQAKRMDVPAQVEFDPKLAYQDAVEQGMYDRIPLSGDEGGHITAQFASHMLRRGVKEDDPSILQGVWHNYGGHTYFTDAKEGLVFAGSNRVPFEVFHEGVVRTGVEHLYVNTPVSKLRDDLFEEYLEKLLLPENRHMPVTLQSLEELGFADGPLARSNAKGKIYLQLLNDSQFVDEVEAMRKLRTVETADVTPEMEVELREAAELLGWRHRANTTGYALSSQRAEGYAGKRSYAPARQQETIRGPEQPYVGVFDKEHFPAHLQEHFIAEGDIEQSYALAHRYPELAAIDGFTEAYTELRALSRMHKTPGYDRFLHELDPDTKPLFELVDWINERLPTTLREGGPENWRIGYPEYFAFEDEVSRLLPQLWEDPQARADLASAMKALGAPGSAVIGAETVWGTMLPTHKNAVIRYLFEQSAPVSPGGGQAARLTETEVIQALQVKLGRSFSQAEREAFGRMWQKRMYSPDENVVLQAGIDPVAELPVEMAAWFREQGMMVTTKRQIGDTALAIEANFDKATLNMFPFEPYQGSVISTISPHELSSTDKAHTFVKMFEVDESEIRAADEMIEDLENFNKIPHRLHKRLYVDSFEGPVRVGDVEMWIGSPAFRSYAHGVLDYADYYDVLSSKYQRAVGAMSTVRKEPFLPDMRWVDRNDMHIPDSFWEPGNTGYAMIEADVRMDMFEEQIRLGREWEGGKEFGEYGDVVYVEDYGPETIAVRIKEAKRSPFFYFRDEVKHRKSQWVRNQVNEYDDLGTQLSLLKGSQAEGGGFNFSQWKPKPEVAGRQSRGEQVLELDFDGVPQPERNAAVQRTIPGADAQNYDYMEVGSQAALPGQSRNAVDDLEELMKAAKYDSIEETKQVFYDLTNKSNIADAMKFIFPFGDAWYEVLSRWAHIMNPTQTGGQAFRNARRVEQVAMASKLSGFISTNEYGEEVFNWPMAPGAMANAFIPNESNVALHGSVPVSSLMFIDPSARGFLVPGISPGVQLATQFLAPATKGLPLIDQTMQWLTYGAQSEYRPGDIASIEDVAQAFLPTTGNRIVAAVFEEENREMLGNIKFRLFETLGLTSDPAFNLATPEGSRHAWDTANTAGTWLGVLRILDAWFLPGQPQYTAIIDHPGRTEVVRERSETAMTFDEILEAASEETPAQQAQIVSILRASNEYRLARELWTDAEADLYMIERYGVLPSMLQSASSGLLERPVTWGGVQHLDDNEWLFEAAPLTLAATVPHDADDTFSSNAWNNLFGDVFMLDGVENQPVRVKSSPSEMRQKVERGAGYDQVRYQNMVYDRAVAALRVLYGEGYSSNETYRARKDGLDRTFRTNIENIYVQFPIVKSQRQGEVIGSRNGIRVVMYVDEIKDIGLVGSVANTQFRDHMPHLADVAEKYAEWFTFMESFSRMQEKGEASSSWWVSSTSETAERMRLALAVDVEDYYGSLDNADAKKYAKWLNQYLLDPLLKNWEWIEQGFAPEMESFPSISYNDVLPTGGFG